MRHVYCWVCGTNTRSEAKICNRCDQLRGEGRTTAQITAASQQAVNRSVDEAYIARMWAPYNGLTSRFFKGALI